MTAPAIFADTDVQPGIRLADVKIGVRARKDYGDLEPLKKSIQEFGVLQPIVLLPGNELLCGGRRLEACRQLGFESITFVVSKTQTDAISRLKAERDENVCRKDMTVSELVALGQQLEELERPKAIERMVAGGRRGAEMTNGKTGVLPIDNTPPAERSLDGRGAVIHQVAPALGLSPSQYSRAKAVVKAAENVEEPDEVREVARAEVAKLDAGTATVSGAYERVTKARKPADEQSAPTKPGPPSQRHVLRTDSLIKLDSSLAGYAAAITDETEIDPSMTSEQATQLVSSLSKSLKALARLNRLIKERTE